MPRKNTFTQALPTIWSRPPTSSIKIKEIMYGTGKAEVPLHVPVCLLDFLPCHGLRTSGWVSGSSIKKH